MVTEFEDWKDVAKLSYANSKKGIVMYRSVVSFAEDTAKELLLKDQKSWQRYIENHIMTIAEKNGIKRENPAMGGCGAWGKEPPSYSCGVLGQVCKSEESVYTAADTQCHPKADDKGHFCGKDTCLCKRERSCSTGNAPDNG